MDLLWLFMLGMAVEAIVGIVGLVVLLFVAWSIIKVQNPDDKG